jgi:nucleotide-binding universal stress UspA family protein
MFASIIVALDGSEQSLLALEHARAIAESFRSKLILVHAFPHTSDLGGGPHCLDSLMDGISSESIVKFFMKHQAASANG